MLPAVFCAKVNKLVTVFAYKHPNSPPTTTFCINLYINNLHRIKYLI